MPLGSLSRRRGRVAFPTWITFATAAGLSCSAPDGRGLFEPFSAGGAESGGGAGSSSAGSSAGVGAGGSAAGFGGEGQGGNLPLAGAAGTGGSSAAGERGDAGASAPDAGSLDAGGEPDAGPSDPPDTCEPSDEVCDGIDNDCDDVIDSGGACPAGCGGFTLDAHAYMFCGETVDRGIALARCGAEGLKLAWIETPQENAALLTSIAALDVPVPAGELLVQIGASDADDEDEWIWQGNAAAFDGFQFWDGNGVAAGGEAVGSAYANWATGEPNNTDQEDCGVINFTGNATRAPGLWDDRACLEELTFLCEEP
jgi:Lectin C-type domain